jgi:hypothetical protein
LAIYVSNGKQYNLKIDSYIDERSDPLKAKQAAKYMSNMYAIFGDWELVLASTQDQEMFLKQLDVQVENKIIEY